MARHRSPQVDCYLPIICVNRSNHSKFQGYTQSLSLEEMLLSPAPPWQVGDDIDIRFLRPTGDVNLAGQVARSEPSSVILRFAAIDDTTCAQLTDLLWPKWDKRDLLEGLILISRYGNSTNLSEWLGLTSVLSRQRPV